MKFIVFQTASPLQADPVHLAAWVTEADDEASAVTNIVDAGIVSAGTLGVVPADAPVAFDVTTNPDVAPSDDPLPFD